MASSREQEHDNGVRRRKDIRRFAIWGVAAVLLAAAFLLGMAQATPVAEEPVIDTAATIDQSQCAPCHLDLGDVNIPGLVFSHGNHLMVSCDGCHSRMPHKDAVTEHVPMETCFACHGVEHGPQGELATGKCSDCHTSKFKLRPADHVKTWKDKPHADAAKSQGVNGCMMCHDAPNDCDKCHRQLNVAVANMPDAYHPMVTSRPKDPSVKIYPTGKVSMSQCVYCHPDLDAITPGRLIFAHAEHLRRNYPCEACHPKFAHGVAGVQKPDMMSCYRCHGLQHGAQGQVATDECLKCHPKTFKLQPADHTKAFIKGGHNKRAGSDPAYCAMCHKSTFCIDCHQGGKKSPNAPGKKVVPLDHRKVEWRARHGKRFLDGKGACGSCHDDVSCKKCHKTVMPHPTGWIENHRPEPGVSAKDCNVCHSDRSRCQECHHQKVERAELIASNCTPCHAEMKTKTPTKIKNKGFAEHAVHFNVAKKKGRPYTCDDCHVSFAAAASSAQHTGAANGQLGNAGHDVRLCYGCHGAVDYKNQLVAPYPGKALCVRCHSDLNI